MSDSTAAERLASLERAVAKGFARLDRIVTRLALAVRDLAAELGDGDAEDVSLECLADEEDDG